MVYTIFRNHRLALQALIVMVSALSFTQVIAQPPATLVVTDQLTTLEFHNQVTLIGRAEANSESRVVASVSGVVSSVPALEGSPVGFGTTLVTIDDTMIRLKWMAKKAEAAQAKAQADLAVANLKRAEALYTESAISESRMQTEMADATTALEKFNQLSAEEKQFKRDLTNCSIIAPYDGYTIKRLIDVGEWVSPGAPVFEVVDLSTIKITLDLPEKHFGSVRVGAEAAIVISNAEQTEFVGQVIGVAPNASAETHTFPIYLRVDNSNGKLAGGMLVRATLNLNEKFNSLAIPKDAIVRQGPSEMIYTIIDGKAAPVPVRTVATNGEFVAVSGEGLSEGMVVVVRGNERIYPGSAVRTAGAAPSGPPVESGSDADSQNDSTSEDEGQS